jgi:transposase InsO family protein
MRDHCLLQPKRSEGQRGIEPGTLTLSTDNGTAYTSRSVRARLHEHGITHAAAATATPGRPLVRAPGAVSDRLPHRR